MKRLLTISATVLAFTVGCTPKEGQEVSEPIGISQTQVEAMFTSDYQLMIQEYTRSLQETASIAEEVLTLIDVNPLVLFDEEWQCLFEASILLLSSQGYSLIHMDELKIPQTYRKSHQNYLKATKQLLLACSYYLEMVENLRINNLELAIERFEQGTDYIQQSMQWMAQLAE